MKKHKIIIVEDDEITSLNLNMSLQKQGYTIVGVCDNIAQAKQKLKTHNPDIAIIDISLQKKDDGIELAKEIRKNYNIPFVYLTSYSDDEIISQAKLTEPYGYIVKPFVAGSLHATIQMALFKFEQEKNVDNTDERIELLNLEKTLKSKCKDATDTIFFKNNYAFYINNIQIYYKQKKIKLTKKESKFLKLLIAKMGKIVCFRQAMDYVWDDKSATENSLRTLVWRLRNKLPTNIIKNVSGIGYLIEDN